MSKKKIINAEDKSKTKGLFDHVNEIRIGKSPRYFDTLDEASKKTWSNYMVCRVLSMQPELIEYINELQKYSGILAPNEFYKVLINLVPKRKAYYPYIKSKTKKYNLQLVSLLIAHFNESERNVLEYLALMSQDDIRDIVKKYGYTEKQMESLMEI